MVEQVAAGFNASVRIALRFSTKRNAFSLCTETRHSFFGGLAKFRANLNFNHMMDPQLRTREGWFVCAPFSNSVSLELSALSYLTFEGAFPMNQKPKRRNVIRPHQYTTIEFMVGPSCKGPKRCIHCRQVFHEKESWQRVTAPHNRTYGSYTFGIHTTCAAQTERRR